MADVIINGTTYSGTPKAQTNPYKPNSLQRKRVKVGTLHIAANGTSTWIHRGVKLIFTLEWKKASLTTQSAVRALRDLTTTFSFTNFDSVTYTVLTVGEDDYEETITTDAANTYLVDITLVLREA